MTVPRMAGFWQAQSAFMLFDTAPKQAANVMCGPFLVLRCYSTATSSVVDR